ncbi:MAG: sugar kinase [Nocardioidaceae bacterium]
MSAPEVLVVGDANLDLVLRGDVRPRFGQAEQLLDAAELTLGGSASLVAHGLARLGVRVALAAAVGRDPFGDLTLQLLEAAGVDVSTVVRRDHERTGLSVILSPEDGDRSILTDLGAIATLGPGDLPDLAGTGHLHVASPYLVEGLRPHLAALMRAAGDAGATTSLDTNDDPTRGWDRLAELLRGAGTVLPNRDEVLRWAAVLGLPSASWQEAAAAVAGLGPTVVVKTGADGGTCFRAGAEPVTVPAHPVTPVDTTGAGDSFDAGYVAGRLSGLDEPAALAWAVAAGSLSTRAAGGARAQADRSELLRQLAGST